MGFTQYATRVQGLRGQLVGLPQWARVIVAIAALPGLALAALSFLGLLVSILALLLLAAPVYALLRRWTMPGTMSGIAGERREDVVVTGFPVDDQAAAGPSPGVKRVDSTVVE
jgi:hypothetical protein